MVTNIQKFDGIPLPVPFLPPVNSRNLPNTKCSVSSATLVKTDGLHSRVSGSAAYMVDINGLLKKRSDPSLVEPSKMSVQKKSIIPDGGPLPILDEWGKPIEIVDKGPRVYRINKKKVRDRINAMLNTMAGRYELYFYTVTFPEGTADEIAYQAMNIWLTTLREKKMIHAYLWIAERQKNGTIHFHFCIPHFMDVYKANRLMRRTLVTFAKRGALPVSSRFIYEKYNGVDVSKRPDKNGRKRVTNFAQGTRAKKALSNYLTKYVTKNDGEFSRLAWHCSREYSVLFTSVNLTTAEFDAAGLVEQIDLSRIREGEYFAWAPWIKGPPQKVGEFLFQLNSYLHFQEGFFHRHDRGRKYVPVFHCRAKTSFNH